MADSSPLSGVNVVLVMAYGSLVSPFFGDISHHGAVVLVISNPPYPPVLFLFVCPGVRASVYLRQKANHAICNEIPPWTSRPHRPQCAQGKVHERRVALSLYQRTVSIVFSAWIHLQGLREDIDHRLSKVQEIRFEPRLLSEGDDRLKRGSLCKFIFLGLLSAK